jgi:dTDP-glucose pyrophosphorylase
MKELISPANNITVKDGCSFREAVEIIDKNRSGIAMIVDNAGILKGVLTDGDIRRAILSGIALESPVDKAMVRNPITVTPLHTKGEAFRIFADRKLSHLPVVDDAAKLLGVIYESTLRSEGVLNTPVVIMAGGYGRRLRPITEATPKPMLKVGDKPMLEIIIEKFRDLGATDFYVSVNYLAEQITDYFGDGKKHRVNINYIREDEPMGTAGSLSLLPKEMEREFFVVNADVLTDMDFRAMHNFHLEKDGQLTVAVKRHSLQVPYGVVTIFQDRVAAISEKPTISNYINAGMYLMNTEVLEEIPDGKYLDMPSLIERLLEGDWNILSYTIDGTWIDIGQPKEFEDACRKFGPQGPDRG